MADDEHAEPLNYTNDGQDEGPWWSGMVACRVCSYRWAAVVPMNGREGCYPCCLECPRCHEEAGDPL